MKGNYESVSIISDSVIMLAQKHRIAIKLAEAVLFKLRILLDDGNDMREMINLFK